MSVGTTTAPPQDVALSIRGLTLSLPMNMERSHAVADVSFDLKRGQILCIIGESGSGKSVSANAVMGLLPRSIRVTSGEIRLNGTNIIGLSPDKLRALRGRVVSMIFQDPLSALNPLMTVGEQVDEVLAVHGVGTPHTRRSRTLELLTEVGLPSPPLTYQQYPFRLSGGQRQRVMIAMALALRPEILIADEPTSALDVTVQAQILQLLSRLQEETGMALILVSHDLGVIAEHTDEVAVMYAGRIVEHGPGDVVIGRPLHPYTCGLLGSIPHVDGPRTTRLTPIPGSPPSAVRLPEGCAFHPRCVLAQRSCELEVPTLELVEPGHRIACPVVTHDRSLALPASAAS